METNYRENVNVVEAAYKELEYKFQILRPKITNFMKCK